LHLEELKQDDDQPTVVASRVAARALFGPEHPYGWPVVGTSQTVAALTLEEVRAKYEGLARPENATILLAGDISPGEARGTLETLFGEWKAAGPKASPVTAGRMAPGGDRLRVFIVDRPEAVQTVIRFITPGPAYTTADRVQYRLLNTLLGGSFTSRLNMNLREIHGYTYGARSSFAMQPTLGYFTASSSVRADVTGESVKEFMNEFARLSRGDVSADEAVKARETLRADVIQAFAGLHGVLSEARERTIAGVPFATLAEDMRAMQAATPDLLNRLALKAIPLNQGVLVLVGDKASILDQIKDLVPPPVEVDVHGHIIGS
jgi:zinc protease